MCKTGRNLWKIECEDKGEESVQNGSSNVLSQMWLLGQSLYERITVQFSLSVVSDSLWPHELQHTRPPCPSPTPGVHSDSRPSSQWCHPTISSSVVPFSSCLQSLPASVFSSESTLRRRWPKYWSFSFSIIPSKEFPGLISFPQFVSKIRHHRMENVGHRRLIWMKALKFYSCFISIFTEEFYLLISPRCRNWQP